MVSTDIAEFAQLVPGAGAENDAADRLTLCGEFDPMPGSHQTLLQVTEVSEPSRA